MGSFTIQNQKSLKKLAITVEGTFSNQDADKFLEAYGKEIKLLIPSTYELNFNASKLNVSSKDMLPVLQGCFELYKKAGFKTIVLNTAGNAILKMQLNSIVKKLGLTNVNLI